MQNEPEQEGRLLSVERLRQELDRWLDSRTPGGIMYGIDKPHDWVPMLVLRREARRALIARPVEAPRPVGR